MENNIARANTLQKMPDWGLENAAPRHLISDDTVYRAALATPGLLRISVLLIVSGIFGQVTICLTYHIYADTVFSLRHVCRFKMAPAPFDIKIILQGFNG